MGWYEAREERGNVRCRRSGDCFGNLKDLKDTVMDIDMVRLKASL